MNDIPATSKSPATELPDPLELSITIAAYREAENLQVMLPRVQEAASHLTSSYEVLVIDTQQAMDETSEICERYGVRHVHRCGGNSYGDAVRTMISEARGRYILNLDGDGSHDPRYFASMWKARASADIVIGSRYAPGGHTDNPLVLIWMSYVVNLTFRIVFSIRAKDVTNSFRLYRHALLKPLRLQSSNFDILEEILIKSVILDPSVRIAEVPVTFGRRKAGESKRKLVRFALGYLSTLRRLRSYAKAARQETSQK